MRWRYKLHKKYLCHKWINKLFSLFEARQVAGSATYKQSKTVLYACFSALKTPGDSVCCYQDFPHRVIIHWLVVKRSFSVICPKPASSRSTTFRIQRESGVKPGTKTSELSCSDTNIWNAWDRSLWCNFSITRCAFKYHVSGRGKTEDAW